MHFGPYGNDPYGDGGEASFPAAPRGFAVRPGLQGPQAVATWEAAAQPLRALMLRRKLREFPRDVTDGELIMLDMISPDGAGECVDVGRDLLLEGAEEGDGRWWYYRLFTMPAPLPLDEQYAGLAVIDLTPTIANAIRVSSVWDVQDRRPVSIYLQSGAGAAVAAVQTAAEVDGPWFTLVEYNLDPAEAVVWDSAGALKYLRVRVTTAAVHVALCAALEPMWLTGPDLSRPCYVFRTGKHHRLAQEQLLPELYWDMDRKELQVPISETSPDDGEVFGMGEDGQDRGPLWRYMVVYLAELDRVHAYLRSLQPYLPNLDSMPPHLFAHVAHQLGYPLEVDGRNYAQVRDEMFRIAGTWKTKGTSANLRAACAQILGIRPRVQEGAGRVLRFADPDLYGVTLNQYENIEE